MKTQIIDAKPWHAGQMVRRLRIEHRSLMLRRGVAGHRELRSAMDNSIYCKAWLIDDHLSGLGGVAGTLASRSGQIWLALSEGALKYPREIVCEATRQIDVLSQSFEQLETWVLDDDYVAQRFVAFFGFERMEESGGMIRYLLERR